MRPAGSSQCENAAIPYILIARGTLLIAAVTFALWRFTDLITLFWVEAAVFVFFMVFWAWQTFELERSTEPAGGPRGFAARSEHVDPAAVACLTPPWTNSPSTYGSLASIGSGSATPTCWNAPSGRPAHQCHRPLAW